MINDKPSVEIEKLRLYVIKNSAFSIIEKNDLIELHFIPFLPEQIGHFPNGEQVEHIMYGRILNNKAYFYKFITVSSENKTEIEIEDGDDPVMEWLKYI